MDPLQLFRRPRSLLSDGVLRRRFGGKPVVSLGEGKIYGLVFPYASPGVGPVALGLAPSGTATDAGTAQALRVSTPAYPADGPGTPDGFALRFGACVDTKGFTGMSFITGATAADVGTCPLRFAPEFLAQDAGTAVVQPLDQSDAAPVVPVTAGTTTLAFEWSRGRQVSSVHGARRHAVGAHLARRRAGLQRGLHGRRHPAHSAALTGPRRRPPAHQAPRDLPELQQGTSVLASDTLPASTSEVRKVT